MQFDINLELAGLIYAVTICIIHRFTHKEKTYSNYIFHKTLILNALMTLGDIVTSIMLNNFEKINPFVNQIASTVFYFLVSWMVYSITRYGDSIADAESDNPKAWFISKALFVLQTMLLFANLVWGEKLFFYVDKEGYHYSQLLYVSFIVPTALALVFAVRLMTSNREQVRRKRRFIICGNFLTIAATVAELFLGYNTTIVGLCTTTMLTIILMNLETPEYTRLSKAMRSYNNDLEKEVESRTRQITDARNNLIYGIAQYLEEKNGTPGHLKRTCSIVAILTEEMKKHTDDVQQFSLYEYIKTAAPLHELGRLNLAEELAAKHSNYTAEEIAILSERTKSGATIVRNILCECNDLELTTTAENMVLYKNENYDGSGYPEGLHRNQIPAEARIIALADEIDRLIGCGPSQTEAAVDKAVTIIEGKMGTRFDPKLIHPLEAVREKIKDFYRTEMPQANRIRI